MRAYAPTTAQVQYLLEHLPASVPRTLGMRTPIAEMQVEDVAWYRDALASIVGVLHDRGSDGCSRLVAKGPDALPCHCAKAAVGREGTQKESTSVTDRPTWRCLVPCSVCAGCDWGSTRKWVHFWKDGKRGPEGQVEESTLFADALQEKGKGLRASPRARRIRRCVATRRCRCRTTRSLRSTST